MTLPVYQQMLGVVTDALLACRKQNGTKLLYVLTTPVPTIGGNASTYNDFDIILGPFLAHSRLQSTPCCPCVAGPLFSMRSGS